MTGLIGVLLLSLIPILIGEWRRKQILDEGIQSEAMIAFLEHLEFRIRVFNQSQERIVADFQNQAMEKNGFLPSLREEIQREPCGALGRTMSHFLEETEFFPLIGDSLLSFSSSFGMQSREGQIRDCEQILSLVKAQEEKGREERMAKANVSRATGLCAGLGIFILLI